MPIETPWYIALPSIALERTCDALQAMQGVCWRLKLRLLRGYDASDECERGQRFIRGVEEAYRLAWRKR